MEQNMFYGATPIIFENAKSLRKNMTDAEKILWGYLKTKPNGFKFRRQHQLGFYIADFYCHKLKLIIELDGSIHNLKEIKSNDGLRQKLIVEDGITVIRFKNKEVLNSIENVLNVILTKCDELSPK